MSNDVDPLLTDKADEYRSEVASKVEAMIDEDRNTHRVSMRKVIENPALLIGATGFGSGTKATG